MHVTRARPSACSKCTPAAPVFSLRCLLCGTRGAGAGLWCGGGHLEPRGLPLHPAERADTLLGGVGGGHLPHGAGRRWVGTARGGTAGYCWQGGCLDPPALRAWLPGHSTERGSGWTDQDRACGDAGSTGGADWQGVAATHRPLPCPADLDFDTPPWPHVSRAAKDLVRRLLQRDPAKRPRGVDILQVGGRLSLHAT